MIRDTGRLANESFDVLIVGGGIAGAGIARDAALRNLRVALIDQGDFSAGTSCRSSKLVHGGLRYLEHAQFRLVREACREREVLLRIAPHLVQPMPLLFPCHRNSSRPFWKLRLGLALYDFLAGEHVVRPHRILTPDQIRDLSPDLEIRDLEGGGMYYDCRMNDARLCLENILAATEAGTVAANYVQMLGFAKSNGQLRGAHVRDLETGRAFEIRARLVVNATGPWADRVRLIDDAKARPTVRTTRGIHLLTRRLIPSCGLAATSKADGRLLFILPFDESHSLIGTTDTDSREDPAMPAIERADVDYLLSETNTLMPSAKLSRDDVKGAFAGLRTLIAGAGAPSAISREYKIEESPSGLLSLIGGKYTTYRVMAARVVDRILRRLGRSRLRNSRLTESPLPSAPPGPLETFISGIEREYPRGRALVHRYGRKAKDVLDNAKKDRDMLGEIIPGSGVIWGEVLYAIRSEMVRRPMDFLRRRTHLSLIQKPDAAILTRISGMIQQELDLDAMKTEPDMAQAREEWAHDHIP